jgi:hypothetical protein
MNKFGAYACALAVAGLAASAVVSVHSASAAVVTTRISLKAFKQQLGLKSVRYVFGQAPVLGITFFVNKKKGTVVFRVNDAVFNEQNPFFITTKAVAKGQTTPRSLPISLIVGPDYKVTVSPT